MASIADDCTEVGWSFDLEVSFVLCGVLRSEEDASTGRCSAVVVMWEGTILSE
jgi:hypothetical protein